MFKTVLLPQIVIIDRKLAQIIMKLIDYRSGQNLKYA